MGKKFGSLVITSLENLIQEFDIPYNARIGKMMKGEELSKADLYYDIRHIKSIIISVVSDIIYYKQEDKSHLEDTLTDDKTEEEKKEINDQITQINLLIEEAAKDISFLNDENNFQDPLQ